MPNESQIYYKRPAWASLTEVSRNSTTVTFKTRGGTIQAFLKDVERWEKSNASS